MTVELAPPDSADPPALLSRAEKFRGLVDAINITDGAGGNCHMSSAAASAVLAAHGHAPVYQIACRDRNRIAIQGDILGAAALGVRNVLCLTGDDVSQGDPPQAKPVFDLDAVSLLHIARGMCDEGQFASGRQLETPPDLFIGATANPFAPPFTDRIANLENKIVAGARFVQTQFCFDVRLFEDFMREVRRRKLHRRAHILVGVGALASAKALAWMTHHVPGVRLSSWSNTSPEPTTSSSKASACASSSFAHCGRSRASPGSTRWDAETRTCWRKSSLNRRYALGPSGDRRAVLDIRAIASAGRLRYRDRALNRACGSTARPPSGPGRG